MPVLASFFFIIVALGEYECEENRYGTEMNRAESYFGPCLIQRKQIMKPRVIRSEQEMTFSKAREIPHQSFPSESRI